MKARTAAEQQIELLRQMKEARVKRKAPARPASAASESAPAALPASQPPAGTPFELSEGAGAARRPKTPPSLPVSRQTWRRLLERQRATKEFRRRGDMGEWAAELLLALPPGVHKLGPEARQELFERMREWCRSRGLG